MPKHKSYTDKLAVIANIKYCKSQANVTCDNGMPVNYSWVVERQRSSVIFLDTVHSTDQIKRKRPEMPKAQLKIKRSNRFLQKVNTSD